MPMNQPMKPFQFCENYLITRFLNGSFPSDTRLPAERELATQIGVTRPTLRETLQSLAAEGWIVISHGKPTMVANFFETGTLALLARLARHPQWITPEISKQLLEVRVVFLPEIAVLALHKQKSIVVEFLNQPPSLDADTEHWVKYDWDLHELLIKQTGNSMFALIFSAFKDIFYFIGSSYFKHIESRKHSLQYYIDLSHAKSDESIRQIVRTCMNQTMHVLSNNGSDQQKKSGELS